jgi:hypothetical protein
MSKVYGEKSLDPYTHFVAGMKDFFRLDKVRFVNIMGSVQYGLLYAIVFFFAGIWSESIFQPFSKSVPIHKITRQVILQCLLLIIIIFYARKFVEAIPGIISFFPNLINLSSLIPKGFVPYGIEEYKGEGMMSLILVGTQVNLIKKIGYLSHIGVKNLF